MSGTPASVRTPVREHVPSVLVAALSAAFGVGLLQIIGFISAARPRLADEIATTRQAHPGRRVVVASYLLAPGYFADLAAAAGGDVTTAPLLVAGAPVAEALVEVVLERYAAASG